MQNKNTPLTGKAADLLMEAEAGATRHLYVILQRLDRASNNRKMSNERLLELANTAINLKQEFRETLWRVHKMEFASNRLREAFKAKWKRRLKKCLSIIPWNALAKAVAWLIIIAIACLFGTATLIGCAVLWKAS